MMSDHTTQMLYARSYDQAKRGEFSSVANLYTRSRRKGRRGRPWSPRSRDSRRLFDLSEIQQACEVDARHYVGLHTVPIERIRGSEGRSNDFDCDFYPLQDHCQERWLRIAAARDQGKVLPPVVLVQVGNAYFVRDGHHRISVARALGQLDIEAEVTVWNVSGLVPWRNPTDQDTPRALCSKAPVLETVAFWLRSLLSWRTRAGKLTPNSSSAVV